MTKPQTNKTILNGIIVAVLTALVLMLVNSFASPLPSRAEFTELKTTVDLHIIGIYKQLDKLQSTQERILNLILTRGNQCQTK
jgi:hypothetical protein